VVKKAGVTVDQETMTPSDKLLESLLGVVEGVAAYGDHLDNLTGDQLALAARETLNQFWRETADYPPGAREHRDEIFTLLLNTQPARVP
jgi:hypothetical protein